MSMAYFDSQNGWIQFVFANEQDTYYLPSLMKVGFYRYLLYCLKKAGYEAVYFWEEYEGVQELSYMDEVSAKYYEKIRPQGFFEKLLGGQSSPSFEQNEWTSVRVANQDMMERLFYQIAASKLKTALVVPMALFDRFFSVSSRAARLIERYRRTGVSSNLVLLTATARAEDSNTYLTRKEGILTALFEEIRQAAIPDGVRNLYETMQDYLGERCLYLNSLNQELIRSIIRKNSLLGNNSTIPASAELIEKMTYVVEWYYHSEQFRRETPIMLPENGKRELQVIDKYFQNSRNCAVILSWLEDNGQNKTPEAFRSFLRDNYIRDRESCYIYSDSFLLRKWHQLKLPSGASAVKQREWQLELQHINQLLRAIVLRGDEHLDKGNLDTCIDQLRRSLSDRDLDTFDYGLRAMDYLLDTYYEQPASREDVWQFYRKIFELSEEIQKLSRELEDYNKQIYENRNKMYQIFQKIEELEQQKNDEDGGRLDIMRQEAVQCDEEIVLINSLSALKNTQRFQYKQAIASMEQAIQGAAGGKQIDVQFTLKQAMDMQQKILQQNINTMKDVSRMTEANPEALGKITGQDLTRSEDLEERYQALVHKMGQLQ